MLLSRIGYQREGATHSAKGEVAEVVTLEVVDGERLLGGFVRQEQLGAVQCPFPCWLLDNLEVEETP